MNHYCTYVDHHYLARAMALYDSLKKHSTEPFTLWILTLSSEAEKLLQEWKVPEIHLVALSALENAYPQLLEAKKNRSVVEYYFTCTPSLLLLLFQTAPFLQELHYLDSDLYFFNDPKILRQEVGSASIAITPHRFTPELQSNAAGYGTYNVGWIFFRADHQGLACLTRWQEQCLTWCYDRCEEGKFGDQKYLDEWPGLYPNLTIVHHPGINAAPWNIGHACFSLRDQHVQINDHPLVLYHFQAFKSPRPMIYETNLRNYQVKYSPFILERIYSPYLKTWLSYGRRIKKKILTFPVNQRATAKKRVKLRKKIKNFVKFLYHLYRGRYFVVWHGRVIRIPSTD